MEREALQVDNGDPFESGVDGIGVIGSEGGLDGGDDPREGFLLSSGLLGHRWREPRIVQMHFEIIGKKGNEKNQ